jgi:protein-S-isoprenylcysteine O-methyltransferase Ste14
MGSTLSLTARSLLWAVLLPGFVAGFAPWYFFGLDTVIIDWRNPAQAIGLVVIGAGMVLLGRCIWDFARRGRGTLSPFDPPRLLVVNGLYRHVRNPMYLGVATIGIGELLVWPSPGLVMWWVAWFALVNVFVLVVEEPSLRRQFGSSYEQYTKAVSRWMPRIKGVGGFFHRSD